MNRVLLSFSLTAFALSSASTAHAQQFTCSTIRDYYVEMPQGNSTHGFVVTTAAFSMCGIPQPSIQFRVFDALTASQFGNAIGLWSGCNGFAAGTYRRSFTPAATAAPLFARLWVHPNVGIGQSWICSNIVTPPFSAAHGPFTPYGVVGRGSNRFALIGTSTPTSLTIAPYGEPGRAIFGGLFFSTASASVPGFGGTLFVELGPLQYLGLWTTWNGAATTPFTIPRSPIYAGLSVFSQAIYYDPLAPGGFVLSHGLRVDL